MSLVSTLQSLEPTALLEFFELDFTDLTVVTATNIDIDVGTGSSGSEFITPQDTTADFRLNLGTITNLPATTVEGGTLVKLYSDTVRYTPPGGYNGTDSFIVNTNEGLVYFHNGTNKIKSEVIWQSNRYVPFPIEVEGFEMSGSGEMPRPIVRIANVLSLISSYLLTFEGLLGAKFTRKRTYYKYIDAVNYPGGVNPTADPTVELTPDVYKINRKSGENEITVEFELASAWDVEGVKLPRRMIVQNVCPWLYRGSECGYVGPAVADEFNTPTNDLDKDKCSKQLEGCVLRFGEGSILPYGGFPGAGLLR